MTLVFDLWRIAVPTDTEEGLKARVSSTLEEAPYITIVNIEEGIIKEVKVVKNEPDKDTGSPTHLRREGVNVLVCRKLSQWSRAYLAVLGTDIIDGFEGTVEEAVEKYLKMEISAVPEEWRKEWGLRPANID